MRHGNWVKETLGSVGGGGHAAKRAPAISAQVAKAWARAARYTAADRQLRGKVKEVGEWMDKNR